MIHLYRILTLTKFVAWIFILTSFRIDLRILQIRSHPMGLVPILKECYELRLIWENWVLLFCARPKLLLKAGVQTMFFSSLEVENSSESAVHVNNRLSISRSVICSCGILFPSKVTMLKTVYLALTISDVPRLGIHACSKASTSRSFAFQICMDLLLAKYQVLAFTVKFGCLLGSGWAQRGKLQALDLL